MSPNSFTFTADVASRAKTNNRVDDAENALTHAARNVKSKTLSAALVRWFVSWLALDPWSRGLDAGTGGDKHSQSWWRVILFLCVVCAAALRVRGRGLGQ